MKGARPWMPNGMPFSVAVDVAGGHQPTKPVMMGYLPYEPQEANICLSKNALNSTLAMVYSYYVIAIPNCPETFGSWKKFTARRYYDEI